MIAEQINLAKWIERGRRYDLAISSDSSLKTKRNENLRRIDATVKSESISLHDRDFYSWAIEQASLLKNGQFNLLDYGNLADELDDMGKSQESALVSAIKGALLHLLKLKYSPAEDPRKGWAISVSKQRTEIDITIQENPGLRSKLNTIFSNAWKYARKEAIFECRVYNEHPNIPEESPFSFDDVVNEDFIPTFDSSANASIEKDDAAACSRSSILRPGR